VEEIHCTVDYYILQSMDMTIAGAVICVNTNLAGIFTCLHLRIIYIYCSISKLFFFKDDFQNVI